MTASPTLPVSVAAPASRTGMRVGGSSSAEPGTIFICGRKQTPCSCGARAHRTCDFKLRGRLEGQICDAPLCPRCAVRVGDKHLCGAHARLEGAKT